MKRLNQKIYSEFEQFPTSVAYTQICVLAVGDMEEWRQQHQITPTQGLAFLAFGEVSQDALDEMRPVIVVSSLLSKGFDCIDLATRLHGLGFSGEYRAIANGIPRPEVIEREVHQLCPQLNFRVVDSL
ncbi:MAG: hypothetical protein AAF718_13250 [Pseudomonadota bacterium]